ncbi:MAG: 30S ribosomal protein S21 [Caudoviricetes sp.]|nr:MAG: 30S ribosomal protein S21 [Caudoviricetes sp.]
MIDLESHPFSMESIQQESDQFNNDGSTKYIDTVERILGHSVDGDDVNGKGVGYSLDECIEKFNNKVPARSYANEIIKRPRYRKP